MDIKQLLSDHHEWLYFNTPGKRAAFWRTNLMNVDFSGADLRSAYFGGTILHNANFNGANLEAADFFGAELVGADLRGANLQRTDLRCANLHHTLLDSPIYQFYLGKDSAVAMKDQLQVGCLFHPWETWLNDYEQIGYRAKYSTDEIDAHGKVIKLYHSLLVGESK